MSTRYWDLPSLVVRAIVVISSLARPTALQMISQTDPHRLPWMSRARWTSRRQSLA
jgi:hypothetical protein